MAKLKTPRRFLGLSSLGEEPKYVPLRTLTVSLYGLTFLFGVIYLISAGTDDLDDVGTGDAEMMKSNVYRYLAVITALTFVLVVMGFYDVSNSIFNILRLLIVVVLFIFVCMTIKPVIDLVETASTPKDGSGYAVAAFTLTFAAITSLLNLLEILRKSSS